MSDSVSGACDVWYITGHANLDPITVFWQDFGEGRGRVTIECYGSAWTAFWGAMGKENIRQFFASSDADYLFNRLGITQFLKTNKGHETYLKRIIRAVQDEVKSVAASDTGKQVSE